MLISGFSSVLPQFAFLVSSRSLHVLVAFGSNIPTVSIKQIIIEEFLEVTSRTVWVEIIRGIRHRSTNNTSP